MFSMGETDDYPLWALPLLVHRMLWKEYGVPFLDYEFSDVLYAIRLQSLEGQRERYQVEQLKKGSSI